MMMKTAKRLLFGIAGLAVLVAAAGIFLLADRLAEQKMGTPFPNLADIPFSLEMATTDNDSSITTISNTDLLGRPLAIFFGFTHCPEICPVTLFQLTDMTARLDQDGKIGIVMITVDPERDTPEVMASFTSHFGPAVRGLSGSIEAVKEAVRGFGIYAAKVALDDGAYTMDHTASVFLYRQDGSFFGTIAWGEDDAVAEAKLQRLLAEN